ncbi:hypothetical protein EVAR_25742_1 [Eumeta japonica]|uniref:Uncharacterized protein n=1 Tax=Eumeta variegata TaxID=151549 RepID=A0A4C1V7A3_EUMVA|nr:hypothetical protein EVAR_25742_1 [Eumeta japonica]
MRYRCQDRLLKKQVDEIFLVRDSINKIKPLTRFLGDHFEQLIMDMLTPTTLISPLWTSAEGSGTLPIN